MGCKGKINSGEKEKVGGLFWGYHRKRIQGLPGVPGQFDSLTGRYEWHWVC